MRERGIVGCANAVPWGMSIAGRRQTSSRWFSDRAVSSSSSVGRPISCLCFGYRRSVATLTSDTRHRSSTSRPPDPTKRVACHRHRLLRQKQNRGRGPPAFWNNLIIGEGRQIFRQKLINYSKDLNYRNQSICTFFQFFQVGNINPVQRWPN